MPYYLCAYGLSGWLDAAIELSGVKHPVVRHTHCVHHGDEACRWRSEWR